MSAENEKPEERIGLQLRPVLQAVKGQSTAGQRSVLFRNRLCDGAGHRKKRPLQFPRVAAQKEAHAMFLARGEDLQRRLRKDPTVYHHAEHRAEKGESLAGGLLQFGG